MSVSSLQSTVYLNQPSGAIAEASVEWCQESPVEGGEIPTLAVGKVIWTGNSKIVKVGYQERDWVLKAPSDKKYYKYIRHEFDILVSLNQGTGRECFVQAIAFITLKDKPMMMMRFYKGGDLCTRLDQSPKGLSLQSVSSITNQMLKALIHLKQAKIIHRDIKPDNIFIDDGDVVKLGDFDLAMREEESRKRGFLCGTHKAMSPEMLSAYGSANYPYSSASDVWAAGCSMFAAFSDRTLFMYREGTGWEKSLKTQQEAAVKNFDSRMSGIATRKGFSESEPLARLNKVLKGMLTLDPIERLSPEAGSALLNEGSL